MELLLQKGANINALNNGECSTLHVAVNKQHQDCVRVLLKRRADVNIQVRYKSVI
jgi:E3 ubiquitin-protein ligase mind-bomb